MMKIWRMNTLQSLKTQCWTGSRQKDLKRVPILDRIWTHEWRSGDWAQPQWWQCWTMDIQMLNWILLSRSTLPMIWPVTKAVTYEMTLNYHWHHTCDHRWHHHWHLSNGITNDQKVVTNVCSRKLERNNDISLFKKEGDSMHSGYSKDMPN